MTKLDKSLVTELEAAAFRRLVEHLRTRTDVQNIDLMNLAGFCRNCLANWYQEAADGKGLELTKDGAREVIYGMPYKEWQAKHQKEASAESQGGIRAGPSRTGIESHRRGRGRRSGADGHQDSADARRSGTRRAPTICRGTSAFTFLKVEPQEVVAKLTARKALGAWNGYLHAGAVVTLADTCCGYGTVRSLPAAPRASPPSSSRATSSARRAKARSCAWRGRCIRDARRRCGTRP